MLDSNVEKACVYIYIALLVLTMASSFIGNTNDGKKSPIKLIRNGTSKPPNIPKSSSPVQERPATAIDPLSHVRLSAVIGVCA